jgi:hypothetical protein
MKTTLTKDADKLACVIYREYLARLEGGIDKRNAKHFKSGFERALLPDESPENFKETLNELCRAFPGTNQYRYQSISIGDDFIIYMESRFPEGVKQVVETLSTIFGIINGAFSVIK